jgi:hypothetical protein
VPLFQHRAPGKERQHQENNKQDNPDKEQNLGHARSNGRNAAKAEQTGDKRNNQKKQSQLKHVRSPYSRPTYLAETPQENTRKSSYPGNQRQRQPRSVNYDIPHPIHRHTTPLRPECVIPANVTEETFSAVTQGAYAILQPVRGSVIPTHAHCLSRLSIQ